MGTTKISMPIPPPAPPGTSFEYELDLKSTIKDIKSFLTKKGKKKARKATVDEVKKKVDEHECDIIHIYSLLSKLACIIDNNSRPAGGR